MENDFRIVITTRDSACWLEPVLDWYRQYSLEPLFIVDARTKDGTRDLIERHGFSFKEFLPRGDYPEAGMLEFGAEQSDSDWILRIDDDELPSPSLLDWVRDTGIRSKNQCWFISRRELYFHNNQILYSRSLGKYPLPAHPDKLHPVARLYNRKRVKFFEEIHTTGLKDFLLYGFAPEENFIIHCNCLIRTIKERFQKLEFYDKINPAFSWSLSDEYLPELFSIDFHRPENDNLAVFSCFFEKLNPQIDDINLNDEQKELIISSVKERARGILNIRQGVRLENSQAFKHYTADDVAWIDCLPRFLCKTIAQFMSTLIGMRNKNYSQTLWNYYEFYKAR